MVVVGDSKQMPPTTFFDRLIGGDAEEGGEEGGYASDLESILGLALGAGCPATMLRWHYRSRHPSLIAVSNRCFYESRLRTFPSPAGAPRPDGDGLTLTRLPEAVYDRARTRSNPGEAAAIAEAVMEHARTQPQLSLGVAAFSQAQMQAIANAIEARRRADQAGEAFFAAHPHEPFFVKNLENVQGDERDVILVSVGYGRDADGAVALNFGPLNSDGGERRLNVLITRARRRMRVFTNLSPEDIDPARTQAKGLLALREFLAYARDGATRSAGQVRLAGVAARLAGPGAEAVGEGGVAWRQGPLAVRLDDPAWCASATCRDRERLVDQVLRGLGWQVHHAWRLGWWRRPDEEARRLAHAHGAD
jgi:superfamily I DNA and/or RNA helicase